MAWFNLLSGPTPERLEQKADELAATGLWGEAKLEYERAHRKLEAANDRDHGRLSRLEEKMVGARDALAREHQQNAARLAEIGDFKEALDLVELALALASDASLQEALVQQHRTIEATRDEEVSQSLPDVQYEWEPDEEQLDSQVPDEQFAALCGTLPDVVRQAYLGYGTDFETGYIALNNGNFETAVHYLSRALDDQNAQDSYIPLELATACLHLDRVEEARQLLERLLEHHPDTLPAYQILCEIYWEQGVFDQADVLLAAIPDELATSLAVFALKGETLFQAGRFEDAKTFYGDFMATYGWNEAIARALARTYEALNQMDQARLLYQEIMGHCSGCHSHIDPLIKEKVADLSFADGIHDTATLELYLALAQELPHKAAAYYVKVGWIYQALGNETEARRFSALAERVAQDSPELK